VIQLRLKTYSYRFAEQVLNSKLATKQELESIVRSPGIAAASLSRPKLNAALLKSFVSNGWESQPPVFGGDPGDPAARMDFLKDRVGVEVGLGHASFRGIDLLKFQVASYSGLDKIDVGIYVVTTRDFQRTVSAQHKQIWEGSLTFEKVVRYLPHFKSAIQVPIYVVGLDL
jgi:hypothetical protein